MKKRAPKISVVIPVYNVEKYLHTCLDSVLNQTFSDWEAICVNDGSTDLCPQILEKYARRDKRIRIISQKNRGLSMARNAGIARARGDYILFLDSDDFIHPQTMEIAISQIMANNADLFLFSQHKEFHIRAKQKMLAGQDVSDVISDTDFRMYDINKIHGFYTERLLFHCTERNHTWRVLHPVHRHCFVVVGLYRRELIADLKFIPGIIFEDFVWWSELLLRRPKAVITNLPLYFYVPNPGSILNSSKMLRMADSLMFGLQYTYDLYSEHATVYELSHFQREFLWPFIIIAMHNIRAIKSGKSGMLIDGKMRQLYKNGVFDNPPNRRARRYRGRIQDLIAP